MLALISLLIATPALPVQDEIVRTAPVANAAYARQDCMFGGQPVACPTPVPTAPVVPAAPTAEDDENPWTTVVEANFENTRPAASGPSEGGYHRNGGLRGTAAAEQNTAPSTANQPFDWSRGARRQASGSTAPSITGEYAAALSGIDRAGTDRDAVPEWAFADPASWESDQCGDGTSEPSNVCRRNARNRLAIARSEQATAAERDGSTSAQRPSRCRQVNEPSQNGGPASASLVCGNGDTDALLDMMRERAERVAVPGN